MHRDGIGLQLLPRRAKLNNRRDMLLHFHIDKLLRECKSSRVEAGLRSGCRHRDINNLRRTKNFE